MTKTQLIISRLDRDEIAPLSAGASEARTRGGIVRSPLRSSGCEAADVVLPMRLRMDGQELSFLSTTTVFGSPLDVTVAELAIESFYPADAATAEAVRAWAR